MIFQSMCLGVLPLLDAVGGLVASLRSSVAAVTLSTCALDARLLDTSHVHAADLVFPCACSVASAAPSSQRSQAKRRREAAFGGRSSRDGGSFHRLAARHERHLTYAVVVAMLQVFLRLTRANATTLLLPMLTQAAARGRCAARVGDAMLVLVNTCGVLGSALAAREFGREAMCAISGVLIVFCQVRCSGRSRSRRSWFMGAAHAGLSGGGARMAGGHAAGMFALACAVSGGFRWAWGALFWAVPGDGIRSAGQAAGAALGFAQMQCFLLTLRQLKHAAFTYYAVWIWS
ncbi:LOW QUALITY PROTEIN: hypothetical protein GQ55_7G165100 [Panicum hallii var. hallii]|uniref:Solute carrier family 40 protein n=1 Tax=Panicum hallii var. hallii TaxID=1504633 RepID=A0A2T7CW25_9POAL|nr:LOW QUALITY PROTEIN: hypothetical protein GQ55_7G165100 [Panicum hallii var. hallii]